MRLKQKWRNTRWKIAKKLMTPEEQNLLNGISQAVKKGYKYLDNTDSLTEGSEVFIRSEVYEIGEEYITCRNAHGYFYTVPRKDITLKQTGHWENGHCSECGAKDKKEPRFCKACGVEMKGEEHDTQRTTE